jgi:hypothetical protein
MEYCSPCVVTFVWHNRDKESIQCLVEYMSKLLSRSIKRPFSRSMNLPVFYQNNIQDHGLYIDNYNVSANIIFIFISNNMVADETWKDYLQKVSESDTRYIIPIAVDREVIDSGLEIVHKNCIRLYDFECHLKEKKLFIFIAHEIYRCLADCEINKTLNIFLSHSKEDYGKEIAKQLKLFIDSNSVMKNFFDSVDIAPRDSFNNAIDSNIKNSTIITIHSDSYSSRYWCQKEIILAKKYQRPIISVNATNEFEDRKFPYAANIPSIRVDLNQSNQSIQLKNDDILRIIETTLLETIRFFYSLKLLQEYQRVGWLESDAKLSARPPEFYDRITECDWIYPEPPLFNDELELLQSVGIRCKTMLTSKKIQVASKKIGISISEPDKEELVCLGQQKSHLIHLSQDVARYLLAQKAILIYGGDLRDNGFTKFLFEEAQILQSRLKTTEIHIENYIAWPIYNNTNSKMAAWKTKYNAVAEMINVEPPKEIIKMNINSDMFLEPDSTENKYLWCLSLRKMRNEMIGICDVRIVVGGRFTGSKSIIPGILEEIYIAVKRQKPVFLLGGFGGVTRAICDYLISTKKPPQLTREWQIKNNSGYKQLLEYDSKLKEGIHPDYDEIIKSITISGLHNGLNEKDNKKLFYTPFVDEALWLIFKGLDNIQI